MAQKIEVKDDVTQIEAQEPARKTGPEQAQKYFQKEAQDNAQKNRETRSSGEEDHYMTLGLSPYIDSTAYRWGPRKFEDPAEWAFVVGYRVGEWVNSTDFLARIEFQKFDFDTSKEPKKFSFMPVLIFPDSRSRFPIYFGGGIGLGILFSQLEDESSLSLDYTLFGGARIFDVIGNTGFFIESGLKNHLHLLSSGQLNGYYFTLGTNHTF